MPDLFRQLSDDADDIAERYRREAANAAAERAQIKVRLAELDKIERTASHMAGRLSALKNVYLRRDQPLCPSCALEGRPPSTMLAVTADDPDSFDAYECGVCGHYTTVPFRDLGTPSGGWVPPV